MNELNDTNQSTVAIQQILMMVLAVIAAVAVLPTWLPALMRSIEGEEPTVFWYLSRTSAMVAYLLVWLSMVLGVSMTNKLARLWPGGPVALDLHQHTSLLGIGFALFHSLILLGDKYIAYTLPQILVPGASVNYKPLEVGLGQTALYLMVIVALSFCVRKQITQKVWRLIHYLSFVLFFLVMAHGILSGSDSATPWATTIYWVTGGSLLFLTFYRVLLVLPMFNDKPVREAPHPSVPPKAQVVE